MLILWDLCKLFVNFLPLFKFYFSPTYPLPKFYLNSTKR